MSRRIPAGLETRLAILEDRLTSPKSLQAPDMLAQAFPQQRAFIEDPCRLKAAFCTRRAAKSYSGGLYAFREAFRYPRCSVLIVGWTRKKMKQDWWNPCIKDIALRHHFYDRCTWNESDLSVRLPNGAFIYLVGMDANEAQARDALGGKHPLVLIDEAQEFKTDLHKLVNENLRPTLVDYAGTICLMGTPGPRTSGLFYEVTTGKEPGWSVHTWSAYQNTSTPTGISERVCDQWAKEIDFEKKRKPGVEQTPSFRRMYLGEWVLNPSDQVYWYQPGRNDLSEDDWKKLSEFPTYGWHRVLGVDLGWKDPTAFSVIAYHDYDRQMVVEHVHKQSDMDFTAVANQIHWFQQRFENVEHLVVDGANKQGVEEMRRRHGLPLIAADKRGKNDFIELMNSEFMTGGIKLDTENCESLIDEYNNLIWQTKKISEGSRERTLKRQEHPACDNHATDATLYAWRFCYAYLSEKPEERPQPGTPAWILAEQKRLEDHFLGLAEKGRQEQAEAELWNDLESE